jgi:hypothetical protein
VLLCAVTGTANLMCSLDDRSWKYIFFVRVAMTAALGMPLLFSLRMLRERSRCGKAGWLIELSGITLLLGYFWLLPGESDKSHEDYIHVDKAPMGIWIRWWLLLGTLHMVAAVSPYLCGAEGNGFWQFNRRLFLRLCMATLYAGVLTVGLELAIVSADKLFDLHLNNAYLRLWYFMAGIFHPVYFLAGVPSDFSALESDTEHPRGLKAFTQFVLAPLVGVYTIILYAYAARILFTMNWPRGWVSMPVLILAGVGILAALLLHPLRDRDGQPWARWFCRNFYRALAPLAVLLLLSFRVRIREYGITEERYMGLVAGGWILALSLGFIVRPRAGIRWIPVSLAAIGLVAAWGPWGALSVSRASQTRRLTRLLAAHNLLSNGKAVLPSVEKIMVPATDVDNIRSIIDYLDHVHGSDTLRAMFGSLGIKADIFDNRWELENQVLEKLKLASGGSVLRNYLYDLTKQPGVGIEGFRHLYEFAGYNGSRNRLGEFQFEFKGNDLLFSSKDESAVVHLDPLLLKLKALGSGNVSVSAGDMTMDFTCKDRSLRIIFKSINFTGEDQDPRNLHPHFGPFFLLEK